MNYLQATTLIWIVLGMSLVLAFALELMYRGIMAFIRLGKPLIVTLPGTPGALAEYKFGKLKEGVWKRKDGDEGRALIPAGLAAYPTTKGPIHIMTDYGANLVAPSKDEVYKKLLAESKDKAKEDYLAAIKKQGVEKDEPLWKAMLAQAEKVAMRFMVHDPHIYWRAIKENDTEDYYAAQQDKPHWVEKMAPLFMILAIVAMGGFVFLAWKVLPVLANAGR